MNTKLLVVASLAFFIFSTQANTTWGDLVVMQPVDQVMNIGSPDEEPPVDEDDELDLLGQCPVWPACGITSKGD